MAKSALATMPLVDAIQELRANLAEAIRRGKPDDLKFDVGDIELELAMVATRDGSGGGKISFGVLGIGAEANLSAKLSDAATHRIKLGLKPRLADGGDVTVSSKKNAGALPRNDGRRLHQPDRLAIPARQTGRPGLGTESAA